MCAVSMIHDYGHKIPIDRWNPNGWNQFQELLKQAEKFDEANGEPECLDPFKTEWMKEIEERIEKLEAEAFRNS